MANFSAMNRAIIDYINANIPEDPNKAHIGTVKSGRVVIADKSYSYVPAVDLYFGEGSRVACLRPDNSNDAIVVGVL